MNERPRFNTIFKEAWPYHSIDGVGLKLTGIPTNVEKFIDIMQSESCNPIATRRILDALINDGVKFTTVMSALNFDNIAAELLTIGVLLTIVPPISTDKLNKQEIDSAAFSLFLKKQPNLEFFSDSELDEIKKRQSQFSDNYSQTPYNFGCYQR